MRIVIVKGERKGRGGKSRKYLRIEYNIVMYSSSRIYWNPETRQRLKLSDIEERLSPYTGYYDTRKMTDPGVNFDDGEQLFYISPGTKVFYDSDRSGYIYTFRAVSTVQPDKEYKFGINHLNQVKRQEMVLNERGNMEWGREEWSQVGGSSRGSILRRPTSSNLVGLDTTQHGDTTSTSTRNRRPVSVPRNPPPSAVRVGTRVRGATKGPGSSNTATMRATHKLVRGGKRKTQKKRKSTKKRNNKKK